MSPRNSLPDRSIRICADRGGTFCDVHAKDYIRLSTTVATNALLERKGRKHALLITKGFKDLLLIGNQSRPRIFDLKIRRPPPLYSAVLEVDERVTLLGYTSDPAAADHAVQFDENGKVIRSYSGPGWDQEEEDYEIVQGLSGEAVKILKKPDESTLRADLQKLYDSGYRSIAVCFVHSYTFSTHELLIGSIAKDVGFEHISLSSQLLPMIKMVPRGVSSTADAYLTPILRQYLDGFFSGFDDQLRIGGVETARVEFMASDGGLLDLDNFSGLKSILSGPAGGVVGYALTSWDEESKTPIIGLDVGGTSTDVSRFDGRYEKVYETTTAGISIQSPQLDINTVAAGGGSCLDFRNGLFTAGPESAGAEPGPACYRKGGPLAVTDANLILGRLIPDYFPKIFGKSEKEPLDIDASKKALEEVAKEINTSFDRQMSLDEVAYGFIKVANETMCRPIRSLTEAKGFATSRHILASFGGAGGQHACEIAQLLGIKTILIHRYSSILSAYGLALADRALERQEPSSAVYSNSTIPQLRERLDSLSKSVKESLERQGFKPNRIILERYLNMRWEGTDTAIMILGGAPRGDDTSEVVEDFEDAFKKEYKHQFGFLLEDKPIVIDDIKVRGIGKTFDTLGPSVFEELKTLSRTAVDSQTSSKKEATYSVYFDKIGRLDDTPIFQLPSLEIGDVIKGPAVILDDTQTIVVIPGAEAVVTSHHLFITLHDA
ncbi:hypothetical protein FRC03_001336 [Tulasnella sp. 419]|nr:hypothetical protein FRC03_001336 [Tulasnella sp. 419]